jgi:hypothetical protein
MRWTLLGILLLASCNGESPTSPAECVRLSGRTGVVQGVVEWRGAPVAGAEVTIDGKSAASTADGSFVLDNIGSGSQQVSVEDAGGYGINAGTIVVTPGTNRVRYRLSREYADGYVFGRILDSCTYAPIAGARASFGVQEMTTGPDGAFSFAACCSTSPPLHVSRNGYLPEVVGGFSRLYNASRHQDVLLTRE